VEFHQTFLLDIRKLTASDFGILLPKNFGAEKSSFQLRHFATLSQISPD